VRQKVGKRHTATILSSVNRLKILFTKKFIGKFVVKWILKIPPPFAYVATFLFLLQDSQCGFHKLFTVTSEHIRLFTFLVLFVFYTFLVVGSVR